LAGLIIEKVSGTSYADFVAKRFFEPLGMKESHYCNERQVVKNRAHGYDMGPGGVLQLKGFIDHTYPYAAGSLCSSAADLLTWLQALHGGRVLPERAYRSLISPDTLNDGTRLRYAKGVAVHTLAGHDVIEHGGGINGFLSSTIWVPREKMAVVVLVNTAGPVSADDIAASIVTTVLGRGGAAPNVAANGDLSAYAGTYQGVGRGGTLSLTFAADSGRLTVKQGNQPAAALTPLDKDTFARGRERITFIRDGSKVVSVRVDRIFQNTVLLKRP
ncbi:MAG TPA: serine hydrolase domain-containing protein, partial [Gemmatimonadaceae bacterium]|nr:serine hydrolase domain-containing protein [Gemmatimonadaceae bacterium]